MQLGERDKNNFASANISIILCNNLREYIYIIHLSIDLQTSLYNFTVFKTYDYLLIRSKQEEETSRNRNCLP